MMLLLVWLPGPMFLLGGLCLGVSVGGSLSGGLCPEGVSVFGCLSRGSILQKKSRGLCPGGSLSRGFP